jgi:hypothetical protein
MFIKEVFVSRVRDFLHEIARLNKKAARIGVAQIVAEDLGKVQKTRTVVTKDEDGNESERSFPVDCQQYRISIPEPADCPWTPIVKITPTDEGAFCEPIISGTNADAAAWKSADAQNCDHCHTRRARIVSYVVKHKTDGRVLQLGRNCFGDYVGEDTLRALEFVSLVVTSLCGDEDGFYGGGGIRQITTVTVRDCVAYAEMLYRTEGWQNNVKNPYSGDLEVEGTHRRAGRAVRQAAEGAFMGSDKIMEKVQPEDFAAAEAAIARLQDTEVSDEFGQTLKNVADYQWVPAQKAGLAAYIGQFLRQIDRKAREAQLNATRVYVGMVGQRATFGPLTCVRCSSFDTDYGTLYINVFNDASGNVLVWKTGSQSFAEGDTVTLKATVKEHSEYRDTKQTLLSRCKEVA